MWRQRRVRAAALGRDALLMLVLTAMACRRDERSSHAARATVCAPWSRCVRSLAASGSTVFFAVSAQDGRAAILATNAVPPGVPPGLDFVGAAMRRSRDGEPLSPLWCRGDEPGCAPTADSVLAFGAPVGTSWVTFASDGALRLRARPPWTSAQPTSPLARPPGFVPRAVSGSSRVLCALAASGRVWCWNRLDLDSATGDPARAHGLEVSALSDADNAELVVGPSPRFGQPLVCARTRRGRARCVWLSETAPPDAPPLIASAADVRGWIEPVVGLALSTHELCATSADRRVACAVGPHRADAFALSNPVTLRPVAELQGAAQLAVVPGLGCARWPEGRARCWGPARRDAEARSTQGTVVIQAFAGATQLLAITDFDATRLDGSVDGVCALFHGALRCVGQDRRGHCVHDDRYVAAAQSGAPWDPGLRGSFDAAAYHLPALRGGSEEAREGLCGLRRDGAIVCAQAGSLDAPRGVRWARLSSAGALLCAADPAGAAWCFAEGALRRTPALDGFASLIAVDGEVCALGTPRGVRCARCHEGASCRPTHPPVGALVGVDAWGCAVTARGERRCGEGAGHAGSPIPAAVMAALGGAVREVSAHHRATCALGTAGRVACDHGDDAWRVEGPHDARALAVSGLICVIRANRSVECWGDDGANTISSAAGEVSGGLGVPAVYPLTP
ncbi:MAG: hypothetical protein U0325_12535 [Polyangiales bacterium]